MTRHILALETSGTWCGVALWRGTDAVILVREHPGTKEHSERLLPMIDEVLAEAGIAPTGLDAIAFGRGPGGFTGLRVACGVAQGLGFALGKPLLPIVSHAAVAAETGAAAGSTVLVAMDARMEEAYVAAYRADGAGGWQELAAPVLLAAADVLPWARLQSWWCADIVCAGDAWDAYPALIGGEAPAKASPRRPTAAAIARLAASALEAGAGVAPELAAPLYVRDKVAFTTAERALGAGGNPRASAAVRTGATEGSA